ncbi:MAG: PAS domain S-box protein, partial [Thermodesulfobacteriota bacterium]|nr:PAS domain S-box protein [Thermodesulfobacteriota bacterium]
MKDEDKTREQLIDELVDMRARIAELEKLVTEPNLMDEFSVALLSTSLIGIYIVQDGKFQLVNPQLERLTGYSKDELLGMDSIRIVHPEDRDKVKTTSMNVFKRQGLSPYEFRALTRNGETVWTMHAIASIEYRARKAVLGNFMDISQRKEAELAVAEEKERLAVTLRSIGDGVICTDRAGNIVLMNGVAEDLTGWEEHDAYGRPLNEVFNIINEKTRERCDNPVEKVFESGGVVGLANHTVLVSKDGTEKILADSGAPIRDRDGKIVGVVLVFRDVTEKRRIEEELQKVAKLESLG